jgi:hypothetical protein
MLDPEARRMAKKTPDTQSLALEALTQALADPTPRPLFGTAKAPGFFKGATQPVKAAAALCQERGWLEATGAFTGKGKSSKPHFRLTAAGVRAALEQAPALPLLQGVAAAVRQQVQLLTDQHQALQQLTARVSPLQEAVAALARRLEPPSLDEIARRLAPAGAPPAPVVPPPPPGPAPWLARVVALAEEQRARDRHLPLSLPDVYEQVRRLRPDLTLGEFHDGLRTLRDERRVRLLPFTRAHATIPDLRNALFLDGEVMFYVDVAT